MRLCTHLEKEIIKIGKYNENPERIFEGDGSKAAHLLNY